MASEIEKILRLATNFAEKAQSLNKKAQANLFKDALYNYENLGLAVPDIANAWRAIAENFKKEAEAMGDPNAQKIYDLLLKEASILESCLPQFEAIATTLDSITSSPEEE